MDYQKVDVSKLDYSVRRIIEHCAEQGEKIAALETALAKERQRLGVLVEYRPITTQTLDENCSDAEFAKLEQVYKSNLEIAKSNTETKRQNEELLNRIVAMVKESGFKCGAMKTIRGKQSFVEYDWVSALREQASFMPYAQSTLENYWSSFLTRRMEAKRKKALEETEKTRNQEAENAKIHLASVCGKLSFRLGVSSDRFEIKEKLLSSDRYLNLAVASESVRNDWSDGCDAVETAISGFVIVDERDKEIHDEISGLVAGFGDIGDGRCFRDCTWNYSVLYGLVDPEIMAMWREITAAESEAGLT